MTKKRAADETEETPEVEAPAPDPESSEPEPTPAEPTPEPDPEPEPTPEPEPEIRDEYAAEILEPPVPGIPIPGVPTANGELPLPVVTADSAVVIPAVIPAVIVVGDVPNAGAQPTVPEGTEAGVEQEVGGPNSPTVVEPEPEQPEDPDSEEPDDVDAEVESDGEVPSDPEVKQQRRRGKRKGHR